jgi:plastocyanin
MRKVLFWLAVLLPLVLSAAPAVASGGGGCGRPITEGAGTSVEISEYCFEPAVLYTSPGEVITWTNRDPTMHDVIGTSAAWGSYESLRHGATRTQTFDKPGVYAYVCTWHPGMSGAVVVGDGGLERLDIAPVSNVQAGGQPDDVDAGPGLGWTILGLWTTLALVLLVGALWRQRRKIGS